MIGSIQMERREGERYDFTMLMVMILLVGVGLSMLFSASYYRAERLFGEPLYLFQRQFIWIVLGSLAAWCASRVSLRFVERMLPLIVFATVILLILTFVPGIGVRFLGARRWIFVMGYSFQPSEAAKVTLIIYLASVLNRKRDRRHDPIDYLLPPLIVVGIFATLIYLQNDFSTAFFIIFLALAMFFVAGAPMRHFVAMGVMALPLMLILLLSREHRVNRILAFLAPDLDPIGTGYQVLASRAALNRGGLWGSGLGQGVRKLGGLPEAHSDFVLAVIGEETGFLGVLFVSALFTIFVVRGFRVALRAKDHFIANLALGLTIGITSQVLLNMAVVCGLVPATGIPLPFFSTGGSSILMTLILCGLLLNLSKQVNRERGDG